MIPEPDPQPDAQAEDEFAQVTPDIERAIVEGEESIAAGRLLRFDSDEEFEAFLEGVAWQSSRQRAVGE